MTLRFSMSDKFKKNVDDLSRIRAEMSTSRMSTMAIMDFEGLGSEFYEEEEVVERDEPIDPVWEAQQISTFTAWCNAHLRKVDANIECFEQDFRSGLKLMKLLEVISGEKLPAPDKGRMRFHKIANVNKALNFVQSKSVNLASIGAEEIVDGNVKMTLGMIWTIILRFTIQDIFVEDSSAKDGLLLWCKRRTNGYKHIPNITSFKTSFQNGLAFCALIHSHDPTLFDYDSLSPKNVRTNLELAFKLAAERFDVPQMLNVDDMIQNQESDEKSIMTYVASYYHAFNKKDKVSTAVSNICSIISEKIKEDNNLEDPEMLAMTLLAWIEKYTIEFQHRPHLKSRQELYNKNQKFHEQYGKAEKPGKIREKLLYEYCCLIMLNSASNTSTSETQQFHQEKLELVKKKWIKLEKVEETYQMYLMTETKRLDKIQNLLEKFDTCYKVHKVWLDEQTERLMSKDYEYSSLYELRSLKREQENFLLAVGSKQVTSEKIINLAKELQDLAYHETNAIEAKTTSIIKVWDSIGQMHKHRLDHIKKYYTALTEIDELQLEFAQRIIPLFNWISQSNIDLSDSFILHCVDEIRELVEAHDEFKLTLKDAHAEFEGIQSVSERIIRLISDFNLQKIPLNPYTSIKLHELERGWNEMQSNIRDRERLLKESLKKQQGNRELLETYQSQSFTLIQQLEIAQDKLFEFICNAYTKTKSLGGRRGQSTEDNSALLEQFKTIKAELNEIEMKLPQLQAQYQEYSSLENSGMAADSYEDRLITGQELSTIKKTLCELLDRVDKWISAVVASSTANRSGGIDKSLLANLTTHDYRDTFQFFDKNKAGKIDSNAFHACLLSLGFGLEQEKENDKYFSEIMNQVDPLNTGFISMNSFLYFMERQNRINRDGASPSHDDNSALFQSNVGADDKNSELKQAFSVIAQDNKFISESVLRENLPESIVEFCLARMTNTENAASNNVETMYDYTSL